MRCTVTFEAAADKSSGALLLHVAILLRQMMIHPEALSWSAAAGCGEMKVWLLVVKGESRMKEFIGALEATDGVHHVVVSAGNQGPAHRPSPRLDLPPDDLPPPHTAD